MNPLGLIVEILWHDAHDCVVGGWVHLSDLDGDACVVRTVGWLVPDFKADHVTIVQSFSAADDPEVRHPFSIPNGMVKAMHAYAPQIVVPGNPDLPPATVEADVYPAHL